MAVNDANTDISSRTLTGSCTLPDAENRPFGGSQTGKNVAKSYRATSSNNNLPPCRICADAASGFHYGVNSCEACKRFFRRALKRKRHFKCKGGNKNCVIKGKKNSLCGYCRYSRCLALGMSKTAIKTGRYTQEKRAQDTRELERLVTEHSAWRVAEAEMTQVVRELVRAHSKVITNALMPAETMQRRALARQEEFQLKKEIFGFQGILSPEQYDEVFQVTGLDVDGRQKHMTFVAKCIDVFVHGYVMFGKGVPGFQGLSHSDQISLLKLARVEVWFLGAYRGFLGDCDIFYAPNNDVRHRQEMERLVGKEYTDLAYKLARRLQAMELTFEEVVVLKAVCLTFTDRCDMDDGAKVEEIQWRMTRCFLHLLGKNHPEDPGLFYRVMNCLVELRVLTELSRKALANTHFSDAIRNNAALYDLILV
ncbi:nuclear hormone receptor E75-like [Babylonia areolata]|uniref:nuclear hormone receptor E75-like n=1 Tax=Babylonia areolata TaxID=304850 RepID=UPI003FD0DAE3